MAHVLAPHQQLAGYEILKLVGKGGMGEVYRARQLSMDRIVALKVLHIRQAKSDAFTKSFIEEARSAGSLSHPNIISVHDVGAATLPGSKEQVHYFSMEFIDGESLKDVLTREGRCPDPLIAVVMNGMAEALKYAEKMGIVHRDIKPDNIMLTTDGLVKLADLGLAVRVGGEQVSDERADGAAPKVMGTPMYMSPEQAKGQKIDNRCDQYCLGATLFHLLTGQPPYRGPDARSIMRSHVYDPVPDPATIRPDVNPAWRQLCMRLMAKQPDQRFTTAADLRAAVHAATHGISLQSFAKRVPRTSRPSGARGMQGVVIVVVLLVLGGGIGFVVHNMKAAPAEGADATPPAAQPGGTSNQAIADPDSGPSVDVGHLKTVLAAIPADPKLALPALMALQGQSEWNSPLAHSMLDEALTKCRGAIAQLDEQALESTVRQPFAAIAASLAGQRLQEAKEQLGALAKSVPESSGMPTFKDLSAQLDAATANLANSYRARLAAATSSDGVDSIMNEAKQAPLSGDDAAQLDKIAAKLRGDFATAANLAANRQAAQTWFALATDLNGLRHKLAYDAFPDAVKRHAAAFQAALPDMVQPLATLGDPLFTYASIGERSLTTYFNGNIRAHLLEVHDAFIDGQQLSVMFKFWSTRDVRYVEEGTRELKTVTRAHVKLIDCAGMLDRTLPLASPTIETRDFPLIKAACAWMWRSPQQWQLARELGNQPLGVALCNLQRSFAGGLEVNADVARTEKDLTISYNFREKSSAMLDDFDGQGLALSDNGMTWTTSAIMPRSPGDHPEAAEAQLPRLAWKGVLHAPCSVSCSLMIHPALLAMAGLETGGRRLRIAYSEGRSSTRHPTQRLALVLTEDDGVHFQVLRLDQGDQIFDDTEPMHLTWHLAEDGTVTAEINEVPVTGAATGVLPTNSPTTFILQAYQFSDTSAPLATSIELEWLKLTEASTQP